MGRRIDRWIVRSIDVDGTGRGSRVRVTGYGYVSLFSQPFLTCSFFLCHRMFDNWQLTVYRMPKETQLSVAPRMSIEYLPAFPIGI